MRKELEILIDEKGKVSVHIKGVKGTACEDIERLLAEAVGRVERSEPTEEYWAGGARSKIATTVEREV